MQNWYLSIPFSPILAIICLAIFLYEYLREKLRGLNKNCNTFLRQVYVDGIMDYKGDLSKDICDGEVKTKVLWII